MTGESVRNIRVLKRLSIKDKIMNANTSNNLPLAQVDRTINWKRGVIFLLLVVLVGLMPFAAAGRLDWWQAWVFSAILIGMNLLSRYLVYRKNPELIGERFRFTSSEGIKNWDRLLAPLLAFVGPLLLLVVAGLDKRNAWSPDVSLALQLAAMILLLLSAAFGAWAMLENPFFSSVVRIQKDRRQTVIASGPYRLVRHPAYSEYTLFWAATPVALGTLWAFIPALLMIAAVIIRTALEDRTLQAELSGYKEYTRRVRYRLLPGVW